MLLGFEAWLSCFFGKWLSFHISKIGIVILLTELVVLRTKSMESTSLRTVTQPELHVINGTIIILVRFGARPASGGTVSCWRVACLLFPGLQEWTTCASCTTVNKIWVCAHLGSCHRNLEALLRLLMLEIRRVSSGEL